MTYDENRTLHTHYQVVEEIIRSRSDKKCSPRGFDDCLARLFLQDKRAPVLSVHRFGRSAYQKAYLE